MAIFFVDAFSLLDRNEIMAVKNGCV